MNIALLVIGDGRDTYLLTATQAIAQYGGWFDHALMVDDTGDAHYAAYLHSMYPDYTITHGGRRGMAGAVQAGFDAVLNTNATHVVWIEEDMILTRDLPVRPAIRALQNDPHLAQICFKRDPVWGIELEHGDQLAAICYQASKVINTPTHTIHDWIFSLNPCVIPRAVIELGWDGDNEHGMTQKLKDLGYLFGSWGNLADKPWAKTIGSGSRTAGWKP